MNEPASVNNNTTHIDIHPRTYARTHTSCSSLFLALSRNDVNNSWTLSVSDCAATSRLLLATGATELHWNQQKGIIISILKYCNFYNTWLPLCLLDEQFTKGANQQLKVTKKTAVCQSDKLCHILFHVHIKTMHAYLLNAHHFTVLNSNKILL